MLDGQGLARQYYSTLSGRSCMTHVHCQHPTRVLSHHSHQQGKEADGDKHRVQYRLGYLLWTALGRGGLTAGRCLHELA